MLFSYFLSFLLYLQIFGMLSLSELGKVARVSRAWRRAARSPQLWKSVREKTERKQFILILVFSYWIHVMRERNAERLVFIIWEEHFAMWFRGKKYILQMHLLPNHGRICLRVFSFSYVTSSLISLPFKLFTKHWPELVDAEREVQPQGDSKLSLHNKNNNDNKANTTSSAVSTNNQLKDWYAAFRHRYLARVR